MRALLEQLDHLIESGPKLVGWAHVSVRETRDSNEWSDFCNEAMRTLGVTFGMMRQINGDVATVPIAGKASGVEELLRMAGERGFKVRPVTSRDIGPTGLANESDAYILQRARRLSKWVEPDKVLKAWRSLMKRAGVKEVFSKPGAQVTFETHAPGGQALGGLVDPMVDYVTSSGERARVFDAPGFIDALGGFFQFG